MRIVTYEFAVQLEIVAAIGYVYAAFSLSQQLYIGIVYVFTTVINRNETFAFDC